MPSYEKFNETLKTHNINKEVIEKINSGFEELSDKSTREVKRNYFRHAIEVIESELPKTEIVDLLDDNGCCKEKTARDKASKKFAKENADKTIEEKIPLIRNVKDMGEPSLTEDGKLYILAVQYYKNDKFCCACPTINTNKKNETPISRTYCMCCAGHFRYHYQIMLGCELELESVKTSPLDSDGKEPCSFIFKMLMGMKM